MADPNWWTGNPARGRSHGDHGTYGFRHQLGSTRLGCLRLLHERVYFRSQTKPLILGRYTPRGLTESEFGHSQLGIRVQTQPMDQL